VWKNKMIQVIRAHLEGTRQIPLTIGKRLIGFEPLRRLLGAPRGYRSVESSGSQGVSCVGDVETIGPIETEEEISLPPARFAIGNEVESKLLPRRLVASGRPVYVLRNGKYGNTAGHFELAVLDANGQLLSELSPDAIGPHLHRIYGQVSFRKEQRIRGRAVVLTTPGARSNYFHWCLELLPKVHLLCSSGLFQPKKDLFLVNHDQAGYQNQTLELLGLHSANVIRTYPGIKITADELIVPSHSLRHEAVPSWAIQFLRGRFLDPGSSPNDKTKLVLDRGAAQRRPILNQNEVHNYFKDRGYSIVDAARLSFKEQVNLFRGVRTIVSRHGAGLANLCFVEAGAGLLEIFSPFYTPDYFRVLSKHLGVAYSCVSGVALDGWAQVRERQRISLPFKLPLDRLAYAVESLEGLS
jgi:Glycosyltransferase 61